jgi:predicted ester cyclase
MVAEGDKVWGLFEVTATHTGELHSFLPYINKNVRAAPTGEKIKFTYVGMYRIVDGKIVDRRSVHAVVEFYKQLGVIEYTEKAKKLFPKNVK